MDSSKLPAPSSTNGNNNVTKSPVIDRPTSSVASSVPHKAAYVAPIVTVEELYDDIADSTYDSTGEPGMLYIVEDETDSSLPVAKSDRAESENPSRSDGVPIIPSDQPVYAVKNGHVNGELVNIESPSAVPKKFAENDLPLVAESSETTNGKNQSNHEEISEMCVDEHHSPTSQPATDTIEIPSVIMNTTPHEDKPNSPTKPNLPPEDTPQILSHIVSPLSGIPENKDEQKTLTDMTGSTMHVDEVEIVDTAMGHTNELLNEDYQDILRATGLVSIENDSQESGDVLRSEDCQSGILKNISADVRIEPASATYTVPLTGNRKKLSKLQQREQTGLIEQLTTQRISCNCEEVQALGPEGNLDRFTLDINNAWKDRSRKPTISWTPRGVKEAGSSSICQAMLSIDGKIYRCCRTIPRSLSGRLYRSSPAHPHQALCDIHVANLRNHHCCPGCGVFCEAGEFRVCSKTQGHLYHDACQDKDRSGDFRCRHCLEASHHITVKIQNPGLTIFEFPSTTSGAHAVLTPRQPTLDKDIITNKYYRDFPLGFRICCGYLPRDEGAELEAVLQDLNMRSRIRMTLMEFFAAIMQGNVSGVLQFLLYSANFDQFYAENGPAAHLSLAAPVQMAIKEKHHVILSVLLQAGFPLNVPNRDNLLPIELAALSGNSVAVLILQKFYDALPSSASRELSLRRLLSMSTKSSSLGMALLFRVNYYSFHEFSFSDDEIYATIRTVVSCRDLITLTHFALCQNIVENLRRQNMGEKIALELLEDIGHEFALNWLKTIGIYPKSLVSHSDSPNLISERFRIHENGFATPSSALPLCSKVEDRIVLADLSLGREIHAVAVINNFDDDQPAFFKYVTCDIVETDKRQTAIEETVVKTAVPCQTCPKGAPCGTNCACIKRGSNPSVNGRPNYTQDGRLDLPYYLGQILYECSSTCSCGLDCPNVVSQKPSNGTFQVYRLLDGGGDQSTKWGLRTVYALPAGYFIGRLVGSVVLLDGVLKYIRPLRNEIFVIPCPASFKPKPSDDHVNFPAKSVSTSVAVITREYGNYTRFMARTSSGGNVMAVPVMTSDNPFNLSHIAVFTVVAVNAMESLVLNVVGCETTLQPPPSVLHWDTTAKLCLPRDK